MKHHFMCVVGALLLAGGAYYLGKHQSNTFGAGISAQRCALRTDMRKLWSDHVWWTRNYIIAALADTPDLKAETARLLKNQDDIGAAIVPYYGKEAGEKLTSLLKEHILLAADLITAAKANNTAKFKEVDSQWHANADAIALFLSSANPHWPEAKIRDMLYEHLKLTTAEVVARLKKEWQTDIETFDTVFNEIMMMSDSLTNGIAQQFPEKF